MEKHLHYRGSQKEKTERATELFEEEIANNLPNLGKETARYRMSGEFQIR